MDSTTIEAESLPVGPRACPECAGRSVLLAALAGHIDRDREDAVEILALPDVEIAACFGAGRVLEEFRSGERAEELETSLVEAGIWSVCIHNGLYPTQLQALGEGRPRALFGAGEPSHLGRLQSGSAAAIIGSRRAGSYGREMARQLARGVAAQGTVVVSGMALGVDGEAHEGALAVDGLTVAVLAAGADRPYPRSRKRLYEEICRRGLVLSELPPKTPIFRWMFPARNRIGVALSQMTVVVEAAERSGSIIGAEMAREIGRSIGAVPGPVTSWRSTGSNALLAGGATVIRDADDILAAIAEARSGESLLR